MDREYAREAEDVVWRRTKLGLKLTKDEIEALGAWMQDCRIGSVHGSVAK
jgi:glycerol-3-phosphate dehydrogenase